METKVKLWMPVTKNPEGGYSAVLSDTSMDRDEEAMGKELMLQWAKNKALVALANHQNSMQTWTGGWSNIRTRDHKGHTALFADPWFFSKEANPLAAQIEKQIEESMEKGLLPGISISAIMTDSETKKVNGKEIKVYTKGELLEATWVPIQSNRNASYGHIAKMFGLESKNLTEAKMTDITQKDIDSAVDSKTEELNKEFEKKIKLAEAETSKVLGEKDIEIKSLTDKVAELETSTKEFNTEKKAFEEKVKNLEADVEKEKKTAIDKQVFFEKKGMTDSVSKDLKAGMIPVSRD